MEHHLKIHYNTLLKHAICGRGWDSLLVYFGHFGQEKGGLPLPVSIQRAAKLPFSLGIFNAAGF